MDACFSIAVFCAPVYYRFETCVQNVVLINLISHKLLFICLLSALPSPYKGKCQAGNDMPYAPPCSDYKHSAVVSPRTCCREYIWIQEQDQTKSGILDAGFYSKSSSVLIRQFE